MIIRKFNSNDLDEVLKLFYDVVHSVGAKYYDEKQVNTWAPSECNRDEWQQTLMNNLTYVVEKNGVIIAFGDMSHEGYLDHLFVHQKHQGSGAVIRILRKLEEDARSLGLKEITTEASITAKPVGEKYGFEVIEEQKKVFKGVEFINYKMRKKLIYLDENF